MFPSTAIGLRIYDLTFDTWPMHGAALKISAISAHEIKGVEGGNLAPVSIVHRRRHLSVKSMAECDRKRQPDGGTGPTG